MPYECDHPEVYVDNYTGEYTEEQNSVKYMWEIEIDHHDNRGNACKIKDFSSTNPEYGFKLRHYLTGMVLTELDQSAWFRVKKSLADIR